MAEWLVPLVTFVLGAVAAFARDYIGVRQESRRERDARAAERAAAVRERREEFELKHLVEVGELLRDAHQALRGFAVGMEQCLKYGEEFPSEADARLQGATGAVRAQSGYLLSDEVRAAVEELRETMAAAESWERRPTGDKPVVSFMDLKGPMERAHELISARVREIYAGRE
ncbi:hypothetical protein ACWF62_17695 [Rhodococcus sp. NPDC054953]